MRRLLKAGISEFSALNLLENDGVSDGDREILCRWKRVRDGARLPGVAWLRIYFPATRSAH